MNHFLEMVAAISKIGIVILAVILAASLIAPLMLGLIMLFDA